MSKAKSKRQQSEPQPAPPQPTTFDRWVEDWRRRPRFYVTWLVVAGVVVTAGLIGFQQFRKASTSLANDIHADRRAADQETDPEVRLEMLADLVRRTRDTEYEPKQLYDYAVALRNTADQESDNERRIELYQRARDAFRDLLERFPKNPLCATPWRLTAAGNEPSPSLPRRGLEYVEERLAFLEEHPFTIRDEPLPDLSATLHLQDPEGEQHELELQFFPQVAPHQVDNFLRLARDGALEGTLVHGIEVEGTGDAATPVAVLAGSAMSKVAPDSPKLWGDVNEDRVGFTLPGRKNHLKLERGRVAAEWVGNGLGTSPFRFAIYINEPQSPWTQRVVFAEVSKGEELLDKLAAQELADPVPGRTSRPPKAGAWKITGIDVTGELSEEHQPASPVRIEPRLPEAPAPEPPPEDREDSGTDTKPAETRPTRDEDG